jgi:hypothetical protein
MNGWVRAEPGDDAISQHKPRLLRKMATLLYGEPIDFKAISVETGVSEDLLSDILCVDLRRKEGKLLRFRPAVAASDSTVLYAPESDALNQ